MIEGSSAHRQVAALSLEPILEGVLAPLAEAMGEFGELVAETCAEKIAAQLAK